ncbi:MAG: hypothetical protein U0Q18_03830 [Bryobacteraceae bacterium]
MISKSTTTESLAANESDLTRAAARLQPERYAYRALAASALIYVFLAGLRTIAEFDLGWQMATGRWIVQHLQIPSTDVLSYTAEGKPWIYPVGSGVIFYALFLVGGYGLLSWMAAAACAGCVWLMLRRGNAVTAALAILAVPVITSHVTPHAAMFTVILFAALVSLLWEQHQTGQARLWFLPAVMFAWANLDPGFVAGLALMAGYVVLEAGDLLLVATRAGALARLKHALKWLAGGCLATLLNPWGWAIYGLSAESANSSLTNLQWAPVPLAWRHITTGLSPLDPDELYFLLAVALAAVLVALARRQLGAALVLGAATYFACRHMQVSALFAVLVVLAGGSVLGSIPAVLGSKIGTARVRQAAAASAALAFLALAAVGSANAVTNRTYLSSTNLVSFGAGQSWWFPERAAKFIQREHLPGRLFTTSNEGGYLAFRLGPEYKGYIDSRAIPFEPELLERSTRLLSTPPESPEWAREADRYGIQTAVIPLGRFNGVQSFPVLKQFCESAMWRPVYLDEVSGVFLRRTPETEPVIGRLELNCSTAPLPAAGRGDAFNRWANTASVLRALDRNSEAAAAITKGLAVFPESGYLHFVRGRMLQDGAGQAVAEQEFLMATRLEPRLSAPWAALAGFYEKQERWPDAVRAWEAAAAVSRRPWEPLKSLGFANLQARRPKDALAAFDAAANDLPAHPELVVDNNFLANIAHGRARSWYRLGDLGRSIAYEEEAANLLPDPALWMQLASLYDAAGRPQDASRTRARAMPIEHRQFP